MLARSIKIHSDTSTTSTTSFSILDLQIDVSSIISGNSNIHL